MRTTFTTTLGAARRSSVETMGPSRSRRVRAAPGAATDFAGTAWAIDPLPLFIGNSRPQGGAGAALGRSVLGKPGGCLRARLRANYPISRPKRNGSFLSLDRKFFMPFYAKPIPDHANEQSRR